mmetsp:Transcript_20908/g.28767  ORF Transcript_20908/g.28767 Transcript_20908/m.28767 type:complete len:272 (-) Transcript_20908:252-1067(-)
MSYPVFKDFDKCPADLIDEDFSTKYTLKIKSAAPSNTTITTNTELKGNALVPKLALKWAHPSGFTLEKLEVASDCKLVVETSLSNLTPGLKLEFKGNDSNKADLSFTYSAPAATVTGEVDFANFSSANASISGGHGAFTGGASVNLKIAKASIDSAKFGLGFGYTVPKSLFVGLRLNENFGNYSALFSYAAHKNITLAGNLSYAAGKDPAVTLASLYKCNPNTTLKVKADTKGLLSASVKQAFEKKFSVIVAAEVPTALNTVKLGVNATLG